MLPRQIATKKISCDKLLQKVAKFPWPTWPPLCATTAGKNADTPNWKSTSRDETCKRLKSHSSSILRKLTRVIILTNLTTQNPGQFYLKSCHQLSNPPLIWLSHLHRSWLNSKASSDWTLVITTLVHGISRKPSFPNF